jgi:mannose-6-phosphate isomerase-like protein (cupin superfamily)
MSLKLVSEDNRRSLYEFGEGDWKCAKYLDIKSDCVVGGHYHLEKDECFFLVEGRIEHLLTSKPDRTEMLVRRDIIAPDVILIPRGLFHEFKIKAGSKLIGLQSEHYNKEDDHV